MCMIGAYYWKNVADLFWKIFFNKKWLYFNIFKRVGLFFLQMTDDLSNFKSVLKMVGPPDFSWNIVFIYEHFWIHVNLFHEPLPLIQIQTITHIINCMIPVQIDYQLSVWFNFATYMYISLSEGGIIPIKTFFYHLSITQVYQKHRYYRHWHF